ncbi:hypothetical protein G6F21_014686 [Rhizopus arrhizus]|nr:hypothetical protein G6F21_014686 [Rhizopus arrhizus]
MPRIRWPTWVLPLLKGALHEPHCIHRVGQHGWPDGRQSGQERPQRARVRSGPGRGAGRCRCRRQRRVHRA